MADQYAGRDLGSVNAAVYRIAQSASYHATFYDVVKGDNTVVAAGKTLQGLPGGGLAGDGHRLRVHPSLRCSYPSRLATTAPEPGTRRQQRWGEVSSYFTWRG
ncbi:MAG TPA: hypothetical protein VMF65_07330 [Acidimicrobiales bacterium]|nr:hypothetical protein [Acidimicrobiales bacterium]